MRWPVERIGGFSLQPGDRPRLFRLVGAGLPVPIGFGVGFLLYLAREIVNDPGRKESSAGL